MAATTIRITFKSSIVLNNRWTTDSLLKAKSMLSKLKYPVAFVTSKPDFIVVPRSPVPHSHGIDTLTLAQIKTLLKTGKVTFISHQGIRTTESVFFSRKDSTKKSKKKQISKKKITKKQITKKQISKKKIISKKRTKKQTLQ